MTKIETKSLFARGKQRKKSLFTEKKDFWRFGK